MKLRCIKTDINSKRLTPGKVYECMASPTGGYDVINNFGVPEWMSSMADMRVSLSLKSNAYFELETP